MLEKVIIVVVVAVVVLAAGVAWKKCMKKSNRICLTGHK